MFWQEELVTSREEALHYLQRHFEDRNAWLYPVVDISDGISDRFSPCVGPQDENVEPLLSFSIEQKSPTHCFFDGYVLDQEFQKKGFGLIGLKSAFGAAYGFGARKITHVSVDNDGPGFWPMIGAVPVDEPKDMANQINRVVQERSMEINDRSKKVLERIAKISEKNPFFGWRALALSRVDTGIKHDIYAPQCYDKDLRTFPAEPGTKQILSRWLGALPAFKQPYMDAEYKNIRNALGDRAAARQLSLG